MFKQPTRKIAPLITAILLFWLTAQPALAAETAFLYPPDKIVTNSASIRMIGTDADSGKKNLRIRIKKDGAHKNLAVKPVAGYFSQLIDLAPGLNTIELLVNGKPVDSRQIIRSNELGEEPAKGYKNYFLHPKEDYAADCLGCHPAGDSGQPIYRRLEQKTSCTSANCHNDKGKAKFMHGPMSEGSCVECHNPHGALNKKLLIEVRAKLCYQCHDDLESEFDRKYKHFPMVKGECLSCHDPHQSNLEFHLKRNSIQELCAGCHGNRATNHKVLHEPTKSGDCTACHNPHVSDFKNLLHEDGNKMCFRCHEVRKNEFERKNIHKPVKEDCTLCHDPHGSPIDHHLRVQRDEKGHYLEGQNDNDACLICHRKLNPEIIRQIENSTVTHKPVAEHECLICHTPHSTNYKKQLNRPLTEICFTCHKKMGKQISKSKVQHGPVKTGNCEQCHRVHGGEHRFLLAARFDTKFYGDFDQDKYRLCFNCHSVKVFLDPKSIETNFRDGDHSLHFQHVNRDNGRGCIICHDIHASDQDKHIRQKTLFKKKYKVKIKFKATPTGGRCVVGCHKPHKYDRKNPVKKH